MKTFTVIFLLLAFQNLAGQNDLIGHYTNNDYYVTINSDFTLEFYSAYGCCLVEKIYGFGKYTLKRNTLIVNTQKTNPNAPKAFSINHQLTEPNQIEITTLNQNEPLPFCNVIIFDINNKILTGTQTDENGFCSLTIAKNSIHEDLELEITSIGIESFSVKLEEVIGKSINILTREKIRIFDKPVYFEVKNGNIIGPLFLTKKEIKKQHRKAIVKQIFTRFPLKWNFKNFHDPIPLTFEKIKK